MALPIFRGMRRGMQDYRAHTLIRVFLWIFDNAQYRCVHSRDTAIKAATASPGSCCIEMATRARTLRVCGPYYRAQVR